MLRYVVLLCCYRWAGASRLCASNFAFCSSIALSLVLKTIQLMRVNLESRANSYVIGIHTFRYRKCLERYVESLVTV